MNERAIKELADLLGPKRFHREEEYLQSYGYDATNTLYLPDAVLLPETTEEVSAIASIATRHAIPLTPRGAGTGQSGGSLPVNRGLLISFTKMDKVLEISPADSLARVQPGVITEEFQRAVERENLFYPPDPASLKNSTLGGNVAENAGGPRCLKYGVTKNYVLGLTAVLPSGEILRTGSRTLKNVVGYDLTSLLVGSEGTLALITEITLKLIPRPESRGVIRLGFPSVKEAVEATVQILGSGVLPSAMEFLDQSALTEVSRFLNIPVPEGTTSLLILELDGRKEAIHADMETLLSLVGPRTTEREFSFDPSQMESLWTMRRQISPTITNLGLHKVNEDIVVPRSRLSEAVEWINGLAKEHDVKVVLFGHIGDGNIHTNFLLRPEQLPLTETLLTALFTKVVSWGGVLSGEHGVGIAKRPYLSLQLSQPEIELMRGVKRVWDPQNLLNPGKIF